MKTIEERAREAYPIDRDNVFAELKRNAYIAGATEQKAIDEELRLSKCNALTQEECDRESSFAEWYRENGKGTPTYSGAIEWARKDLLDEVCAILAELGFFGWLAEDVSEGFSPEVHKDQFRKCFIDE